MELDTSKKDKRMAIREFPKHDENPFIQQAIEEVQVTKKYVREGGGSAMLQAVDPKSGEIVGHTMFIRQVEVDEQQFAKLYLSQFKAFWDIRPSALRVFGYLLTRLKPRTDEVLLKMDDCMKYCDYSTEKPIREGITDLLRHDIIARGWVDNMYFINPLVVFNGDRVSFIKTYVKKKKQTSNPNQLNLLDQIDINSAIEKFEADKL